MRRALGILLVLATAGPLLAADKLVWLSEQGQSLTPDQAAALIAAAPDKVHTAHLHNKAVPFVVMVVLGSPAPAPPPTPTPTPTPPDPGPPVPPQPTPTPAVTHAHVTLVVDPDTSDPVLATTIRSVTFRQALERAGHKLRVYDSKSDVLDARKLRPHVQAAGVPSLIVQTDSGQVLLAVRCPTAEADLLAAIAKATGGK